MAWLAVDKDGSERIFTSEPEKGSCVWFTWDASGCVSLSIGSIEKLIGRPLTWEDEPVEI